MELTKTKFKKSEVGLIPEDWKVTQLKDCLIDKLKYGIGAAAVPFDSNLPVYLRITDINDDGRLIKDDLKSVNHPESSNYYLDEGDIVFARTGASVGKSYLYKKDDGELVYAGFLIRAKPNKSVLTPRYLIAYLSTNHYWNWVRVMSMRSGQPGINSIEYGLLPIPLPPTLTEQKAIATALSDVDEMIAKLEKLIEKKKAIKQGAMQQLLTPPHKGGKRLEGFSGEWTRSLVKDVIKVSRGGSPRPIQDFITTSQSGINWIKIGDTSPFSKYINSSQEKIIPEGQSFSRNVFVGDFLLSNSMSFGRPYILNINGCIHDGWLVLQEYSDYFDKDFLYYTLMTTDVYRQYLSKASGSSVLNLNKELVQSVVLNRPVDLDEQRAISKILSDLDLEILEREKTKIKLEKIKQGMMQELLTGRTRLI